MLPSRRDDERAGGPGDRRQQGHRLLDGDAGLGRLGATVLVGRAIRAAGAAAAQLALVSDGIVARPTTPRRRRRRVGGAASRAIERDVGALDALVNNAAGQAARRRPHRRARPTSRPYGRPSRPTCSARSASLSPRRRCSGARRGLRVVNVSSRPGVDDARRHSELAHRGLAVARLQLVEGGAELGHGAVRQRARATRRSRSTPPTRCAPPT